MLWVQTCCRFVGQAPNSDAKRAARVAPEQQASDLCAARSHRRLHSGGAWMAASSISRGPWRIDSPTVQLTSEDFEELEVGGEVTLTAWARNELQNCIEYCI